MGRHAGGGVRSRLTAKTVGLAAPIVVMVAAGAWWAVDQAVGSPGGADTVVAGSAVVVSSLACHNGDEGTVVDIRDPAGQPPGTTRRATMDSCGHQPGEVLAVDYAVQDPGRVTPSGTESGAETDSAAVVPLGLGLAGLLGLAAGVAVVRDGRRGRAADGADHSGPRRGRHARPDEDETPVPDEAIMEPEPRISGLDLLFPSPDDLAASLHDELFTHRSPAGV